MRNSIFEDIPVQLSSNSAKRIQKNMIDSSPIFLLDFTFQIQSFIEADTRVPHIQQAFQVQRSPQANAPVHGLTSLCPVGKSHPVYLRFARGNH
ncbi:MAG: hypothetical protein CL676_01675 [Bdellovibrionaceae bacterium]|nr:hypothetical protein [Pseudobdellovibrionaceae bacterium]